MQTDRQAATSLRKTGRLEFASCGFRQDNFRALQRGDGHGLGDVADGEAEAAAAK
jgi:hypothetical protein